LGERYTIKNAERCFETLLRIKHKRKAKSYKDVGGWQLDYNPIYGGVVVEEIHNAQGGVSNPLGFRRRTPREFCDFVYGLSSLEKPVRVKSSKTKSGARRSSHRRSKPRKRSR
jgi:hypothetical protein